MLSSTSSFFVALIVLLARINPTLAHGTITGVTGANGVQAAGFGIIASTPRDGSTPVPFEQDTSVIRDIEIKTGKTGVCGKTKAGGNNDVASQLAAASNAGLPTTSAAGELTMTLHQVNQDGAGPYTCEVSTDGGNTFQAATVTTNVPGIAGLSLAKATDFPLVMQVDAATTCTGGPAGNACIARCRNPALAGPFGSCVAFAMGGASNATAAAATVAASAAAAAAPAASTAAAAAPAASAAAAAPAASAAAAAPAASAAAAAAAPAASAATDTAAPAAAADVATPAAAAAAAPAAASSTAKGGKLAGFLGKILGGAKREEAAATMKKRVINSRVAGANAGYWIDA